MYNQAMKIGIVGASGLVGEEVINLLLNLNHTDIKIFSRTDTYDFEAIDILFLCTPAHVSEKLAPLALEAGVKVIDLSSAFRKDANVPLILPEINGHLLEKHSNLIACPNCIVAIMLMVLGPLHKAFEISRIQITTYQAASGAGKEGLLELLENRPPKIFPHRLAHNLFLHESTRLESGYSEEEDKIIFETKKILNAPEIGVNVRSVRVPTLRAHSMAVNVTFNKNPQDAFLTLTAAKGILFHTSPTPQLAEHKKDIFYGPIRQDLSAANTLDLWICGDQLLRGAALTAIEISQIIQLH